MKNGSKNFGLAGAILILALGLRLLGLNQGLWLDEAAQARESLKPAGLIIRDLELDFHPPLYHLVLHFWLLVSRSEVWLRFLSVILGTLTVWGVFLLGSLFDRRAGILAALFLAINPFHLYYSQEVRPYPLAALTYLYATLFFCKWLNRPTRTYWLLWVIFGILAIYSIYPAGTWLPAAGLFLYWQRPKLTKSQLKSAGLGLALVGLSFLPWRPRFQIQLAQGQVLRQELPGWGRVVSPEPFKALPLTLGKFVAGPVRFSGKVPLILVFGSVVILLSIGLLRQLREAGDLGKLWLSFGLIPLLILTGLTFFLPVLEPKRVIFGLPIFLVTAAAGMVKLKERLPKPALAAILLIALTFGAVDLSYALKSEWHREQWREAVDWAQGWLGTDGLALFSFPQPLAPWLWYADSEVPASGAFAGMTASDESVRTKLEPETNRRLIFHFRYLADLTDPSGKVPAYLLKRGYRVKDTVEFAGVGFIDIYIKNV